MNSSALFIFSLSFIASTSLAQAPKCIKEVKTAVLATGAEVIDNQVTTSTVGIYSAQIIYDIGDYVSRRTLLISVDEMTCTVSSSLTWSEAVSSAHMPIHQSTVCGELVVGSPCDVDWCSASIKVTKATASIPAQYVQLTSISGTEIKNDGDARSLGLFALDGKSVCATGRVTSKGAGFSADSVFAR